MKINKVDYFYIWKYELTHKSRMLPDAIRDSYAFEHESKNIKYKRPFTEKIIDSGKKILSKIFPDYVVETQNERTGRLWSYYDASVMYYLRNGGLKLLKLSDSEINKIKNMNDTEVINFIRNEEKTGRFKYIKKQKFDIFNYMGFTLTKKKYEEDVLLKSKNYGNNIKNS